MGAGSLRAPSEFNCRACFQLAISKLASRSLALLSMSTTRAVWFFIIALTAIRLSMLATTDLEFDETHYWMWSERLAPAYFSKGPGIAFAMRASTAVFGANEFGVRFFSPILAAGTSLLLFYFARRLFSATAGLWAVIALNVTPIFNIGAFLMTIDSLSVFFWLAAMLTFWLAVEKSPGFSWHWPLTGLLIGLGFLSKYTNALELVSILRDPVYIYCSVSLRSARSRRLSGTTGTPGSRSRTSARAEALIRGLASILVRFFPFSANIFWPTRHFSFSRWPGASLEAGDV